MPARAFEPIRASAAGRANERIVYFNGEFVPESRALVPFRDRSFIFGDGVFDTARTFGGRPFRLAQHVERLYRSLKTLRIEIEESPAKLIDITEEVLRRNAHLLDPDDDYWVTQRISRGVMNVDRDLSGSGAPNLIVECTPLPLRARACLFRDGIEVIVPSIRRVPPDCLPPRAKTHNYLNVILGDLEAKSHNPDAWAVLLDVNGNLAEGMGSNVFVVKDGAIATPREKFVLPGVTRQTVIELAEDIGIPWREDDLDLYDAHNADEMFLTSTSLCICPVRSVNGARIGEPTGELPGPVTGRLMDAFSQLVDFDYVGQYLRRLD